MTALAILMPVLLHLPLCYLNLSHSFVGETDVLAPAVAYLAPSLKHFDLSYHKIPESCYRPFASSLAKLSKLEFLSLSHINLSQAPSLLFCALKRLKKLQFLDLSSTSIESKCDELATVLLERTQLHTLRLDFTPLGTRDFVALLSAIGLLSSLKTLGFRRTRLSAAGFSTLFPAFSQLRLLERLFVLHSF